MNSSYWIFATDHFDVLSWSDAQILLLRLEPVFEGRLQHGTKPRNVAARERSKYEAQVIRWFLVARDCSPDNVDCKFDVMLAEREYHKKFLHENKRKKLAH